MRTLLRSTDRAFRWVVQPLLVVLVLAAGFMGAMGLSSGREAPERSETAAYAPLVRVIETRSGTSPVTLHGNGALRARTRIDLVPRVTGEVLEVHPGLRAGGSFRAGETLLRIDPRDYELAVAQSRAEVQATRTSLTSLEAEAETARDEWARLRPDDPISPLAALEPQLEEARARSDAARASLERAELDLNRTQVRLPFDGRVVEALVDVGEVTLANQPIASVYATDVFELVVYLRLEQLAWIDWPEDAASRDGSRATLRADVAGEAIEISGRVVRLEAELDTRSRLAGVVIEIPLDDVAPKVSRRLLPGLFMEVEFEGPELSDVSALPRATLRDNGRLWIVKDGRLLFHEASIRHADEESLLVAGLDDGTVVVTSDLEVVTDGMEVRTVSGDEAQ